MPNPTMRHLTEFPTEKAAQALADYLEVHQIESSVRSGTEHEVWVLDDDQIDRAQELLADYDDSADHSTAARDIRSKREKAAKPPPGLPARQVTTGDAGPITLAMIGFSIFVAVMSELGNTSSDIIHALLVVPFTEVEVAGRGYIEFSTSLNVSYSEPWRLLTPMFIHFGFLHIGFNMMWLYRFGGQIEGRSGFLALIMLAIVAQFAGSVVQFHLTGALFGGMSGVNYALFGYVWMQSTYGESGYSIESRDTWLLMIWLLVCATGLIGPVANACHALGLVTGLLAGLPAFVRYSRKHTIRRSFEKDSWADLNITGWRRFERLYVQPYVPFWFLATAIAVMFIG